ncbi:HTH domain-containing protein [Mycoplasmatota bacterium]|nr:HTH domain-containing protein [Mycoplasmatota bacterium]
MESRIIETALELLIMFVIEKKELKKSDLAEHYGVSEKTIRNHFQRINAVLANRFIYLSIEYDYTKKMYTVNDLEGDN